MTAPGFVAACTLVAGSLVAGATPFSAQNYPDRVVRVITTPAGSGSDFAARLISQALTRSFAQQVIVDNRGNTAAEIVGSSPEEFAEFIKSDIAISGKLIKDAMRQK